VLAQPKAMWGYLRTKGTHHVKSPRQVTCGRSIPKVERPDPATYLACHAAVRYLPPRTHHHTDRCQHAAITITTPLSPHDHDPLQQPPCATKKAQRPRECVCLLVVVGVCLP
jgi:hypothetical protein